MKPVQEQWLFVQLCRIFRCMAPSKRANVRAALDCADKSADDFVADTLSKLPSRITESDPIQADGVE